MTGSQEESRGLMAFWADIDPDYLLRYQEWHNCEHMPERVSIPGFDRGLRYRAQDGGPHFLMFYETETSGVLASDAYLAALNRPTPWTSESLTHFRNPVRNIYALMATSGSEGPFVSPYVTSLRFNLSAGDESRREAYAGEWLERLASLPSVLRARLYQVDEEISGIMTSERKIYGGGPGEQRYLVLTELELPFDRQGDPLVEASEQVFGSAHGRSDEFQGRYWLEMSHARRT